MEHWWKNSTLNRNPVGGTANLTVPQVLASCTEASCSPARITQKSEDANQVLVEITWSRIRRLAAANSPTSALSTRNRSSKMFSRPNSPTARLAERFIQGCARGSISERGKRRPGRGVPVQANCFRKGGGG